MTAPRTLATQLRALATQIEKAHALLIEVDARYPYNWPSLPARVELASAAKRARKLADKVEGKRTK